MKGLSLLSLAFSRTPPQLSYSRHFVQAGGTPALRWIHDVKEREREGVRHWLQAPVLPEPQGFSLPSCQRKGCGRRLPRADADLAVGVMGAQQRLPRSF